MLLSFSNCDFSLTDGSGLKFHNKERRRKKNPTSDVNECSGMFLSSTLSTHVSIWRLHPALRRFTRRVKEKHREGRPTATAIAWWEIENANTRHPNAWSEILKPAYWYSYYVLLTICVLGEDVECVSKLAAVWGEPIWIAGATQHCIIVTLAYLATVFLGRCLTSRPHKWCFDYAVSSKSPNDGQTDRAVAQIIFFFLLKHQAHSTDIFSTSWQSKEQQKKELEQQRFLFQYNLIQPATAPSHQWGGIPPLCNQRAVRGREDNSTRLKLVLKKVILQIQNTRVWQEKDRHLDKTGKKKKKNKRNIGPQKKYKIFCIKFYYHSTGKKSILWLYCIKWKQKEQWSTPMELKLYLWEQRALH